jgi:aspartyl-tRNA(Asn)/glutamyl-tRNA(Gln) amidotransferase subunit A
VTRTDPLNAAITWLDEPMGGGEGPLTGRTLLVKDLIDTAGVRTTYGSRIYADHVPKASAPAVTRLLDAGAVVVGKANLPEFAFGVMGQNPWYGTVHNPVRPGLTTGGSSAGNAAALAAGLVDLGLGTDTGCSIRLPAACCEIVGLKPRWGSITTEGVFPLVPSLDTVGPMARTVADVALLWSVLTGNPVPEPRLAGLEVGLLTEPPGVGDGARLAESSAAEQYVADLERSGARVVPASIPDPNADVSPVFFAEALRSHRETFPARADEYGENCRTKLARGERVSSDELALAYAALTEWRAYVPAVDLYVAPVVACELPPEDADELEWRGELAAFLRPFNYLGWSALAIGNLQLVARSDEVVLAAGLAWEQRG